MFSLYVNAFSFRQLNKPNKRTYIYIHTHKIKKEEYNPEK